LPSKKHKPGWRFTVATYDVEPTLIFHRPECKEANPDEVLQEILKHPVLGPAAAFGLVIDRDEATTERFEVHFDAAHCLLPEVALNPNEYVYYVSVDGKPLEKLDLYEVYYSCTLPHKINTGCEDCMQEQTVRSCRHKQFIKKCHSNYVQEMTLGHTVTAEHFTDALKNRKDVVADCLYISPTLTAPQHFMKKLRPPADHDFDMEEEHSDNRKKAARERKRKKQFIAEVCSECLVHTACHGDSPFYDYSSVEPHDITYCRGHYAMSEEEAVEEILANYTIPYDDEFLQRVLYFAAGELPKRINNKKAHLTCFVSPGRKRLAVGVMYTVQGYHEELIRGDLEDLVLSILLQAARIRCIQATTPDQSAKSAAHRTRHPQLQPYPKQPLAPDAVPGAVHRRRRLLDARRTRLDGTL